MQSRILREGGNLLVLRIVLELRNALLALRVKLRLLRALLDVLELDDVAVRQTFEKSSFSTMNLLAFSVGYLPIQRLPKSFLKSFFWLRS